MCPYEHASIPAAFRWLQRKRSAIHAAAGVPTRQGDAVIDMAHPLYRFARQ